MPSGYSRIEEIPIVEIADRGKLRGEILRILCCSQSRCFSAACPTMNLDEQAFNSRDLSDFRDRRRSACILRLDRATMTP
jgi:hypothetical protein